MWRSQWGNRCSSWLTDTEWEISAAALGSTLRCGEQGFVNFALPEQWVVGLSCCLLSIETSVSHTPVQPTRNVSGSHLWIQIHQIRFFCLLMWLCSEPLIIISDSRLRTSRTMPSAIMVLISQSEPLVPLNANGSWRVSVSLDVENLVLLMAFPSNLASSQATDCQHTTAENDARRTFFYLWDLFKRLTAVSWTKNQGKPYTQLHCAHAASQQHSVMNHNMIAYWLQNSSIRGAEQHRQSFETKATSEMWSFISRFESANQEVTNLLTKHRVCLKQGSSLMHWRTTNVLSCSILLKSIYRQWCTGRPV